MRTDLEFDNRSSAWGLRRLSSAGVVGILARERPVDGDIVLPVAGRRATWTARTPAVAGMKLPSTRV